MSDVAIKVLAMACLKSSNMNIKEVLILLNSILLFLCCFRELFFKMVSETTLQQFKQPLNKFLAHLTSNELKDSDIR